MRFFFSVRFVPSSLSLHLSRSLSNFFSPSRSFRHHFHVPILTFLSTASFSASPSFCTFNSFFFFFFFFPSYLRLFLHSVTSSFLKEISPLLFFFFLYLLKSLNSPEIMRCSVLRRSLRRIMVLFAKK